MKPRRLTVSRTYYAEPLLRRRVPAPARALPQLRLQGRWLEQAGFAIGAQIEVAVAAGELIVKVLPPAELSHEQRG